MKLGSCRLTSVANASAPRSASVVEPAEHGLGRSAAEAYHERVQRRADMAVLDEADKPLEVRLWLVLLVRSQRAARSLQMSSGAGEAGQHREHLQARTAVVMISSAASARGRAVMRVTVQPALL